VGWRGTLVIPMDRAFVFDPNLCTGCQACRVACGTENPQSGPWRQVHTFNPARLPSLPRTHLSLACHHCEEPACLRHCPAGAYSRGEGRVDLRREHCLGCRYCTWACPHDAPRFDPAQGLAEKCTLCAPRLGRGLAPACVARCPTGALAYREPGDLDSAAPGFPQSPTRPGIRFLPLSRQGLEAPAAPGPDVVARWKDRLLALPPSRITLRGEWSLVLFTHALALLVAWAGAGALGRAPFATGFFLAAGALVLSLSALHLGRPLRAWRALLNLRTSWLSREILAILAFLGLGGLGHEWAALVAGLGALFTVDRIYRVALRCGPWNLHSAHTLFNGLYLLGLWAGLPLLWIPTGLLKLGLYLHRKAQAPSSGRRVWSLLRLALGFGIPALGQELGTPVLVAAAALGDLIDRCEYYVDLVLPSPGRDLVAALRTRLA
jgi:Fe-S-cluster-containing dehydrogenase component